MAEEIETPNNSQPQPLTLNEKMVAAALDVELATLRRWRTKGEGPVFVPVTRETVVYLYNDVADFLMARRRHPGGRRS